MFTVKVVFVCTLYVCIYVFIYIDFESPVSYILQSRYIMYVCTDDLDV